MRLIILLILTISLSACLETRNQNNSEGFYNQGPKRTQKLSQSSYSLNWSEQYNEVIEVTEPFELRAQFTTRKNLKNVNVSWVIPEGVEVLKGPTTETYTQIQSRERIDLSVTLQASEDINHKIILIIGSKASENPFALSKQINTHIPELN